MRQHKMEGMTSKHKFLGKIEGISGTVQLADTLDEAIKLCNGEKNLVKVVNAATKRNAKQAIYSRGVNAQEDDTANRFNEDVQKILSMVTPVSGRIGPSVKDVRNFANKIQSMQLEGKSEAEMSAALLNLAKELGMV